jgi:tetratricopeptide (TPR) repeat protein
MADYSPRTLRYDIEHHQRLPVPDCVQIGLSLATALAHLHQHGLVHRDIKPSNVIFVNGVPKLGDIGLVTEAGDTQSIVGTEGYIPPEGPGTPRADLYSLGKLLYEISTGLDRRRFAELPEEMRTWPDRGAVEELNEIVLKACAKDPARRYPSAEALRADLAILQRGQSVKRKRTVQRRVAVVTKLSLVAGLIALMILGGLYLRQSNDKNELGSDGGTFQPEMKGTKSQEAWNAYITALHHYRGETEEGSKRALELLKEAIRLDPKFAQPYAVLAEIYRWRGNSLSLSGQDSLTKGKEAALQALALDQSLAKAHVELAYAVFYLDRDFPKATNELKRAIALSPNFATAHAIYAWLLLSLGNLEEAKKEIRLCLWLDPVYPRTLCEASIILRAAVETDEALRRLHKALDVDSNYWWAFQQLAEIHEEKGEFPEAIEMLRKTGIAREMKPDHAAEICDELRRAYASAGERGYWRKKLELRERRWYFAGDFNEIAAIHMHLGEREAALDFLEKGEVTRGSANFWMNFDRRFDGLRSEPRFQALIRKLGLEPHQGDTAP